MNGKGDASTPARALTLKARKRIVSVGSLALLLVVFSTALELTYAVFMSPRFGYLGYMYRDPDRVWMFASLLLLLAVSFALPRNVVRVSDFAVWFLYVALLVPISTVPYYGSDIDAAHVLAFAAFCSAVWVLVSLVLRIRFIPQISLRTNRAWAFWVLVAIVSVCTYTYLQAVVGISFNLISVFEIYETRLEYRDELIPSHPILGYLIANQGNVVNPILMAFGVYQRRWYLIALGIAGQLALYSATGYKTALLSIVICVLLSWLLRDYGKFPGSMVLFWSTLVAWVSILVDKIVDVGMVDIVVSRVFLTAGYLMPLYLRAYEQNPPALWAYSFLSPFVESPYSTSPGFFVAETLLQRPDIQLNASLFADGYANFGLMGIAIEAVALVVILLVIDRLSNGLPIAIVIPASVLPVFSLANGSPFTSVLSYGFLLLGLLFLLIPRDYLNLSRGGEKTPLRSVGRSVVDSLLVLLPPWKHKNSRSGSR